MKSSIMDMLVGSGNIKSYHYSTEEFEPGSDSRMTEIIVIEFNDGKKLKLETFCSGSNENSSMIFSLLA